MRFWNWLWTLSGFVGIWLSLFKHRLTVFQIKVAKQDGLYEDSTTRTLLHKYLRDTYIRGFVLTVIFAIGVGSFTTPSPPPFSAWTWYTWLSVLGFEAIAVATLAGVAFDLRDRLRLIYGSVWDWLRSELGSAPGRDAT